MPSAAEFGETQKKHCVFFYGGLNNEGRAKHAPSGGRKFVQTRAEDKLVWTMPSAAEFGETQKKHCVFFYGGLNNEGRAKHAPSGGRKFVQTRAEDKLVWTMPSAAEFGETQKIAQQFLRVIRQCGTCGAG